MAASIAGSAAARSTARRPPGSVPEGGRSTRAAAADEGSPSQRAEASYYTWVDWHNTLGLGDNVPIDTGNASEALLALKDGKWVVLRVPYPTGFYTKWMDGRIDDAKAGWKGRGVYATISTRTPFHMETGRGTTSKVMHFQMRPDPLAK